jgi:hypothetical protein
MNSFVARTCFVRLREWFGGVLARFGLTLLVAACAPAPFADLPIIEPARRDVLAPYEAADWPRYLKRLALPTERDYVILSFLPTKYPLDLSTPAKARRSFLEVAVSPGPFTRIGHAIVGWQCGNSRGMTSMTGAQGPEAFHLLREGWGLVPLLSVYSDGRLYPEGAHRRSNLRGLDQGYGIVVATGVSRTECEEMRSALVRFITHPNQPATRYGLSLSPERLEGGGCISFGFYLANAAGIMGEVARHIHREVPIHSAMLGRRGPEVPGLRHYRPPVGCCDRPLTLDRLLLTPWETSPIVDRRRVEDGELVIAALVAARIGVAPAEDWRWGRVLPRDDPAIAHAWAAGEAYAARYRTRRIADPGGVQALVLEQR